LSNYNKMFYNFKKYLFYKKSLNIFSFLYLLFLYRQRNNIFNIILIKIKYNTIIIYNKKKHSIILI
jgi:hypothetical protein